MKKHHLLVIILFTIGKSSFSQITLEDSISSWNENNVNTIERKINRDVADSKITENKLFDSIHTVTNFSLPIDSLLIHDRINLDSSFTQGGIEKLQKKLDSDNYLDRINLDEHNALAKSENNAISVHQDRITGINDEYTDHFENKREIVEEFKNKVSRYQSNEHHIIGKLRNTSISEFKLSKDTLTRAISKINFSPRANLILDDKFEILKLRFDGLVSYSLDNLIIVGSGLRHDISLDNLFNEKQWNVRQDGYGAFLFSDFTLYRGLHLYTEIFYEMKSKNFNNTIGLGYEFIIGEKKFSLFIINENNSINDFRLMLSI